MTNLKLNKQFLFNIIFAIIFLFGLFLRLKIFVSAGVFEDDECRLAIAFLVSKNLFLPLIGGQSAPPIFLFATKFITSILGDSEYIYKIIPFLASVGSLIVFYKLCREYFQKTITALIGFLLFTVNISLLHYSYIFKPYSTDVLIALLCLYFLPKIKLENTDTKRLVLITFICILLPFISLPSLFFIGAFFLLNLSKKLIFILIPFGITMILYYYFNLHPSSINMQAAFPNYWNDGFLSFSINSFLKLFVINFKSLFIPNLLTLFQLILLFWGMILACRTKKFHFMLIVLGFVLLASFLHLYPFEGRVALYSSGIFILLMMLPLEIKSKNGLICSVILLFLSFYNYINLFPTINERCIPKYSPKVLITELSKKYNEEKDTIIINKASTSSYIYYSKKADFFTNNVLEVPRPEELKIFFESLPKDKNYWIFIVKDYINSPNAEFMISWAKKQKTFEIYKDKSSYLIYVKN